MQKGITINKYTPIGKSTKRTRSNNFPPLNPELAEALGLEQDSDVKTISSEFHTLFIEEETVSPGSIVIPMEIISQLTGGQELPFNVNELGESIQLNAPEIKMKKYTLFIGDFMQADERKEPYYKILKEFSKAEPEDQIVIYVSSDGGSIDEGIQIMKHIRSNFTHDNITTILDPKGYSMGSFMFLIGNTRVISEDSKIMLHNYSMGAWGKGGEIKDYVDFSDEIFKEQAHKRYVDTGYITEGEFEQFLIGKEWWFNCKTMCERKMATHVSTDNGELFTAEEYLEKLNPTQKVKETKKPVNTSDKPVIKKKPVPKKKPVVTGKDIHESQK